jgi:ribosomal protein S18 acetylase RimI-like enzyme
VRVAAPSVTLRPVEARDEPFLRRVYAGTRADELALIPWSRDEQEEFLRQQFDAQDAYYSTHYDNARFDVIEVDGEPAGRLYVARWDDEIRIIEIALLPEHRGRGVGTALIRELLEEAAQNGQRVSIHVEKHNPALRLYERLGFEPVADRGVYLLLEASP